ncbi:MAG: polysaccharide biosynthesis/export family protein [Bacteroidales bacterium]
MKTFHAFILALLLGLLLPSCHPYKRITYISGAENKDTLWPKNKPEYRLQSHDILYIRILSQDEKVNDLYNPLLGGSSAGIGSMQNMGSGYLYGYQISDSGTIAMPVLGTLRLSGLTLKEAQNQIQTKTDTYLNGALAVVKLFEFKVSFIGVINNSLILQTDQLTLFEALSKVGGLPYSGRWRSLVIIRQEEKGTRTITVNPTDPALLASQDYYLQPNDVVYVKPNARTAFRATIGDYLLLGGTLTTAVSTVLLLLKL